MNYKLPFTIEALTYIQKEFYNHMTNFGPEWPTRVFNNHGGWKSFLRHMRNKDPIKIWVKEEDFKYRVNELLK